MKNFAKLTAITFLLVGLSACKIEITVPENGQVSSESGAYLCTAGSTCVIDVSDALFNETFVAQPDSGFDFVEWGGQFCAGSTVPCHLFTVGFAGNSIVMGILASNTVFGLSPVFERQTPPGTDPSDPLVELGEVLFFNETFGGNGRTCGTCHRAENNFTIDPAFIATLPQSDPLFVSENNADLTGLEDSTLLRQFGLIRANADGFEDPTTKFVARSVSHLFGMASTIQSNATQAPFEMTGWSGDGAPGAGTLRDFSTGAVVQHFTLRLDRVEGVDFRLPTAAELDALEAFMLSLGTPATIDLEALRLVNPAAERGRIEFITEDSENGTKNAAKCNACHKNGGALTVAAINQNFNTGVENVPHAVDVLGVLHPRDGGFGTQLNPLTGGFGDGTFNPVPLVHAADTAPYFHNNVAATLEEAIAHYASNAFRTSLEGQRLLLSDTGHREMSVDVDALAAFLRVINMMENIRSSTEHLSQAKDYVTLDGIQKILTKAMVDLNDVVRVLNDADVHENVMPVITGAQTALTSAMAEPVANTAARNSHIDSAISQAEAARDMMVAVLPPLDTESPSVSITAPASGSTVVGSILITADASDDAALSNVVFKVGDSEIGRDATPPFEMAFNTTTVDDGTQLLTVTAIDSSNNSSSVNLQVNIDNASVVPPPDTTSPTVAISNPSNGDTAVGIVQIDVDATDDTGVTAVTFAIDGIEAGLDIIAPYQHNWDTTAFSEGSHNISVTASDAAGNSASTNINLVVDNITAPPVPCTVYSCPNPPPPPTEPPPPPITPSGSSPDGEFQGEVTNVDFAASTVTVDSGGVFVTVKITSETTFNGSIAPSIGQILIGHVAEGEFFQSNGETVWIDVDLPPGF